MKKDIRQSIWDVLRENKTHWLAAHEIAGRAEVLQASAVSYLNLLRKAGFVEFVLQETLIATRPVRAWRLLKNVGAKAPRLKADGSLLPEHDYEVIWRTAKILKRFTVDELHQYVAMTHDVRQSHVQNYLNLLVRNGFAVKQAQHFVLTKLDAHAPTFKKEANHEKTAS